MKRRKHKLYYIISSYRHALQHIWRNKIPFPSLMVVVGLSICVILIVFVRSRIYNDAYYIQDILVTEQSLMQYNDINLYADIMSLYREQYYHTLHRWKRTNILDTIQRQYPFVSDVILKEFSNNTLLLDVSFHVPLFRLRYNDSLYAMYTQHMIPLFS